MCRLDTGTGKKQIWRHDRLGEQKHETQRDEHQNRKREKQKTGLQTYSQRQNTERQHRHWDVTGEKGGKQTQGH